LLKAQNSSTTNGDSTKLVTQQSDKKIMSTDLESTLASLADNLDIKGKGFQ
jgi:hypothetical protein